MRITIFKESWNMICALNSPVYCYHSVLHETQFFDWLLIIESIYHGKYYFCACVYDPKKRKSYIVLVYFVVINNQLSYQKEVHCKDWIISPCFKYYCIPSLNMTILILTRDKWHCIFIGKFLSFDWLIISRHVIKSVKDCEWCP